MRTALGPAMSPDTPFELRVEAYADGELLPGTAERIGAVLAQRWPVEWDVSIPAHVSFDHPAEWRGVVLLPAEVTPEKAHQQLTADFLALEPGHTLHFRTRWDFPQAPDQREVYEERWRPTAR